MMITSLKIVPEAIRRESISSPNIFIEYNRHLSGQHHKENTVSVQISKGTEQGANVLAYIEEKVSNLKYPKVF